MPILKDLILEGRSAGVQEGAVRLLTRLCSTPDAREQVSPHDLYTWQPCPRCLLDARHVQ